ncbi:HlyD family efflux transporter periplasmic adaptor subunit [Thalassomonas sp. RHCl1]|uniref:efflux RND transporter periplasmic adaptor subunit n=1 Tax=Thalassomonas sp. RHCl1 TaxID=2995320 RepID=UPI00248BEA7D|nr:HlyD family efflux transporter periplasmic adaptor subunit [Thalassomonas sp. RHCl1]
MDFVKQKKEPQKKHYYQWGGLFGVAVLMVWLFVQPSSSQKVFKENVTFGEIKKGDLQLQIEGYGVLRSNRQKLVTAYSGGTVEEILLKPGAAVTPESIILTLSNPALEQEVETSRQELEQQQANLRQIQLNNKREFLSERERYAAIEADYEIAKVNRDAQEKLAAQGIVSAINLREAKIEELQLEKRLAILQERIHHLEKVHQEAVVVQGQIIKQHQGRLNALVLQLEKLSVKANLAGVLQRMPVELGQNVSAGEQLAVIGSTKDLVAMLQVPQTQISAIKLGQVAVIDTRQDIIKGQVKRIDPAVEEGNVTVEIALLDTLPDSARPELDIDGTIITDVINNTYYIERPVNTREHSTATIFKVNEDKSQAQATQITYGVGTERFIQILSGVNDGDIVILSDMSSYQQHSQLSING